MGGMCSTVLSSVLRPLTLIRLIILSARASHQQKCACPWVWPMGVAPAHGYGPGPYTTLTVRVSWLPARKCATSIIIMAIRMLHAARFLETMALWHDCTKRMRRLWFVVVLYKMHCEFCMRLDWHENQSYVSACCVGEKLEKVGHIKEGLRGGGESPVGWTHHPQRYGLHLDLFPCYTDVDRPEINLLKPA